MAFLTIQKFIDVWRVWDLASVWVATLVLPSVLICELIITNQPFMLKGTTNKQKGTQAWCYGS